jgi:hypothetical protein
MTELRTNRPDLRIDYVPIAQIQQNFNRAAEIDPLYVDVIIRRWQRLTGKSAICVADGLTFADRESRTEPASAVSSTANCEAPAEGPRP